MCAVWTRPEDHGGQEIAGWISSFSVVRGLGSRLAVLSTWALISCTHSEISGFRPLGPAGSDDKYVHEFSNFVFPKQIGNFIRVSLQNLDPYGREVSVIYNSDSGIMLTVYVYPTTQLSLETEKDPLEEHFRGVKGVALRNSPGAKLVSEGSARLVQNGKSYSGKMAVMTMEDFRAKAKPSRKRPKGISELRVFRLGEHFIRYRMAYTEAIRGKAEKEIKDFMSALKWPAEES